MNREIKFRGFSKSENKWFYSFLTFNKESGKAWIGSFAFGNYYFVEVAHESVGQFTGLHDKNGVVEAYEKDICIYNYWVQTSQDPNSLGKEFKGIGVIEFVEGCFMIKPISGENPTPLHYSDLAFEIIGNVYQNQELINKKL